MTTQLLRLVSALEMLTALALLIAPSSIAWLLFGHEASFPGSILGQIAGIVLLALSLTCYPINFGNSEQAVLGMLTYNTLITIYLIYLGIRGEWTGVALWPVAAIHAVLTLIFTRVWFKGRFSINLPSKENSES